MSLFRPHRGSLEESLHNVINISSKEDLIKHLKEQFNGTMDIDLIKKESLIIKPIGYDNRTGWDTFLISIQDMGVMGHSNNSLDIPFFEVEVKDGKLFVDQDLDESIDVVIDNNDNYVLGGIWGEVQNDRLVGVKEALIRFNVSLKKETKVHSETDKLLWEAYKTLQYNERNELKEMIDKLESHFKKVGEPV